MLTQTQLTALQAQIRQAQTEAKDLLLRLEAEGMRHKAIAEKTGLSEGCIYHWLRTPNPLPYDTAMCVLMRWQTGEAPAVRQKPYFEGWGR